MSGSPLEKLDSSFSKGFFVSFTRQGEGGNSLYQTLLADSSLYKFLLKLDEALPGAPAVGFCIVPFTHASREARRRA
jgi:hypothetical protein